LSIKDVSAKAFHKKSKPRDMLQFVAHENDKVVLLNDQINDWQK
jgi:hypothetical protein